MDKMNNRIAVSIAGYSLLAMFVVAVFDTVFGGMNIIVWDDAVKTFSNLKEQETQFRLHIFFFMLMFILDIFVAFGFYLLLKPVNKYMSLLCAWFRVMYTAMIGAVAVNHLNVLHLISGSESLAAFQLPQLQAQVMSSLKAFDNGFNYALVFFGFHLLIMGLLIYRSGYVPKILGILIFAATAGYIFNGVACLILPDVFNAHRDVFNAFFGIAGVLGEGILALYLVIRRKKVIERMGI